MSKNSAIELHDSTITEIARKDSAMTVRFRPAVVHSSDGTPGVDRGTVWLQDVDLDILDAHISQESSELGDICDGSLSSAEQVHTNCVPLPYECSGPVKFTAVVAHTGEQLIIHGQSAAIKGVGSARYLEEFK